MMRQVKFVLCLFVFSFAFTFFAQAQEEVELKKAVITATKTEHTLGDVPVAAEVITREEVKAKNTKTLQDALKYISGIKVEIGWLHYMGFCHDQGHYQVC
jgi:outer membrane receptor for ferrienterochelin and colicins